MKQKKTATILILMLCLVLLAGGAFLVMFLGNKGNEEDVTNEQQKVTSTDTFAAWTNIEEFRTVPSLVTENSKVGEAADYGNGHYVIDVNGTTTEDYLKYLDTLEKSGFKKHSDNGKDAMDGYAKTASYTKDDLTVTVSHAINLEKTYISAVKGMALSEHLIYKEEYVKGVSADAKTTLHMLQLNNNGASFVIQLKNGHFIIHDGGRTYDAPYLLDYLESLTPDGEKPIVEAWFISHAHGDHHGALMKIIDKKEWYSRIYVDGIYFMEPTKDFIETTTYDAYTDMWTLARSYVLFEASDGGQCKYYRPQFGQRYYFCDMYIDVCLTPEQFPLEAYYSGDFNETSIWLMHHIEGQKTLIVGDTSYTGMDQSMNMFDKSYLDVDVYAVSHHGINVYNYFTDFMTVKTALYPNWRVGSLWQDTSDRTNLSRVEDNKHLVDSVAEAYSHENGTVVLTFPYKVGEAKTLGQTNWIYNAGRQQEIFE